MGNRDEDSRLHEHSLACELKRPSDVMQRDRADRLRFYSAWEEKVLGQARAEKEEVEKRRRQAVRAHGIRDTWRGGWAVWQGLR